MHSEGWKIIIKKETITRALQTKQLIVGIIGEENVGKTLIVNKLANESYGEGYHYHTEGLCVKFPANYF